MKAFALVMMVVGLAAVALTAAAQHKVINTPAHVQGLPYSDAVLAGDTLYVSGNVGQDPKTGKIPENFSEEARQSLQNLGTVLKAAGYDYKDVVKVNVFLADMSRFDDWNKVYREFFSDNFPARSTVAVSSLALGAKLEVEMIAVKKK
jgi:2-iminobutanoate/2-iminopropanoate deaminase